MIDGTEPATMIVACVKQLPSRFGIELIADVHRSSKSTKNSNRQKNPADPKKNSQSHL